MTAAGWFFVGQLSIALLYMPIRDIVRWAEEFFSDADWPRNFSPIFIMFAATFASIALVVFIAKQLDPASPLLGWVFIGGQLLAVPIGMYYGIKYDKWISSPKEES